MASINRDSPGEWDECEGCGSNAELGHYPYIYLTCLEMNICHPCLEKIVSKLLIKVNLAKKNEKQS